MARRPDGYDVYDFGASKGVYQPPLCVMWHGRWHRTHPRTAPSGQPFLSAEDNEKIMSLGRIRFGALACKDNLVRRDMRFGELPLFDAGRIPAPSSETKPK